MCVLEVSCIATYRSQTSSLLCSYNAIFGSHIATQLVVLVVVVLNGATLFKKPKASSFQIGSRWSLARTTVLRVNVNRLNESDFDMTSSRQAQRTAYAAQTWAWVHFYPPKPNQTHLNQTQPNPTHFMLLADPTQPIAKPHAHKTRSTLDIIPFHIVKSENIF